MKNCRLMQTHQYLEYNYDFRFLKKYAKAHYLRCVHYYEHHAEAWCFFLDTILKTDFSENKLRFD